MKPMTNTTHCLLQPCKLPSQDSTPVPSAYPRGDQCLRVAKTRQRISPAPIMSRPFQKKGPPTNPRVSERSVPFQRPPDTSLLERLKQTPVLETPLKSDATSRLSRLKYACRWFASSDTVMSSPYIVIHDAYATPFCSSILYRPSWSATSLRWVSRTTSPPLCGPDRGCVPQLLPGNARTGL
jgi:hypothetical protein